MGGDEKKGVIVDEGHNELNARYHNPDNAPIPAVLMDIKKSLLLFPEVCTIQSTRQPKKAVQSGNEAGLLIDR